MMLWILGSVAVVAALRASWLGGRSYERYCQELDRGNHARLKDCAESREWDRANNQRLDSERAAAAAAQNA